MKKQLILQLIFWSSLFYAQPDSLLNSLDYYPLHVGDFWQYQVEKRGVFPSDSGSWIGYKEVVGDTVMDNGEKYFIIIDNIFQTTYSNIVYKRIDSTSSVIYNYTFSSEEKKVDSLLAKEGDEIYHGFNCVAESSKVILALSVETKLYKYQLNNINSYEGYEYAKGLGETMRYFEDISVYLIRYEANLIYAKIGSKEYGIMTNIRDNNYIPEDFHLSQNYPNPFNPSTKIKYSIPSQSVMLNSFQRLNSSTIQNQVRDDNLIVTLKVFDILGREVATLVNEQQSAGNYKVEFNATNLKSGIYFYSIRSGKFIETKKMVIIK